MKKEKVFKIEIDFGDYPHCQYKETLNNLVESLEVRLDKLKEETEKIQKACDCPINKQDVVMVDNPDFEYNGASCLQGLKKIFGGTRCSVCKRFNKNEGDIYTICSSCGSSMNPPVREMVASLMGYVYKCPKCNFFEWHT